ncbi:hypothetical protein DFA_09423 [Cavenderia fasciculata]|uniref:EF-hand domain-containing protein n=1 Tax=Cavenderia fasciculata TaxID=261658 RepID=F4Q7K9_CACFS|nr:uncharacterized protein DFA_09423 [Cavenderia fasciculata]EGG16391.1 hypothetical protein DFA_09423 [Cavenderia fasciculata]|eukprot:XP_004354775.1 hypothetical protein DFA_09423 [Cavenderia fasciculata]
MNREQLSKLFKGLDKNSDGILDSEELSQAFSRSGGPKPSLAEIHSMIKQVDTSGKGVVGFDDFVKMCENVKSGSLPSSTGIPSLITGAWEEHFEAVNKPVEKNVPISKSKKGKGEASPEAEQGQKYALKGKTVRATYNNLPSKKSLADLP